MRLKRYITEAYDHSACDKYDGIERSICNWIRNESPITWGKERREECMDLFGNVRVGTVWRGTRIDTEEDLEMYRRLKNGGTIELNYASASPHKDTAKSFAWYVKSYDELTMMYALKSAMKNGSAGRYGSVLLELEPDPSTVVFKTWKDGTERKGWVKTEVGLESEALLYGRVRVKSCKIWEPLRHDNFEETIMSSITRPKDLDNAFLDQWIYSSQNLSKLGGKEGLKRVASKLFDSILRTEDDVAELFSLRSNPFNQTMMYDHPAIREFIIGNMVLDDGRFRIVYKNKDYAIPNMDHYLDEISQDEAFVKQVIGRVPQIEMIYEIGKWGGHVGHRPKWDDPRMDHLVNIIWLARANPSVAQLASKSQRFKKLNKSVDSLVEELLSITHESSIDHIEFANHTLRWLGDSYSWCFMFHPRQDQIRKKIARHFYNDFLPHGGYDGKEFRDKVYKLKEILPLAIKVGIDNGRNPR